MLVHTYPFYIVPGPMNPKGLPMFIPFPLPKRGTVYTPYKVGWKPRKPLGMNKGYVIPPVDKVSSRKALLKYGTKSRTFAGVLLVLFKWVWVKIKQLGQTADFSLPFHLLRFQFGPLFLSHTQMATKEGFTILGLTPLVMAGCANISAS